MLEPEDAAITDECLASFPRLLLNKGVTLKQKLGYKAGKLTHSRNWCQLVDGNIPIPVTFPNSQGQKKTWKLFARFSSVKPPAWPWVRPERYVRVKAQWMPAGDDVWGIAYEDLIEWGKSATSTEILERLANDLQASLDYSRRRYC